MWIGDDERALSFWTLEDATKGAIGTLSVRAERTERIK
jgi:hypothetical protein